MTTGAPLNFPAIQRAIKAIYALNEFDVVQINCDLETVPEKTILVVNVTERVILGDLTVVGPNKVSERTVKEKIDLLIGRPIDPLQVARARARIDSVYEAAGYYLAIVKVDSTPMGDGRIGITYSIDEGRRLAISGIDIIGNENVKDGTVVGAMKTHPEGFWWFRKGGVQRRQLCRRSRRTHPGAVLAIGVRRYADHQRHHVGRSRTRQRSGRDWRRRRPTLSGGLVRDLGQSAVLHRRAASIVSVRKQRSRR